MELFRASNVDIDAMTRESRIWVPNSVNHVIARGNRKQSMFLDELDYRRFLVELKSYLPIYRAVLYAYCLMPNHIHLIIKAALSLSELMHRVLTKYAGYVNDRHELVGHLVQDRFRNRIIMNDRYFSAAVRYVHFNPVKAKLVARTTDWPWSSARAYAGAADEGLISLVPQAPEDSTPEEEFESENGFLRDPAVSIGFICREEAKSIDVSPDLIRSSSDHPRAAEARRRLITRAAAAGYSGRRIAEYVACSRSTVTRVLREEGLSPNGSS